MENGKKSENQNFDVRSLHRILELRKKTREIVEISDSEINWFYTTVLPTGEIRVVPGGLEIPNDEEYLFAAVSQENTNPKTQELYLGRKQGPFGTVPSAHAYDGYTYSEGFVVVSQEGSKGSSSIRLIYDNTHTATDDPEWRPKNRQYLLGIKDGVVHKGVIENGMVIEYDPQKLEEVVDHGLTFFEQTMEAARR
jgi:hypothetical protein